MALLRIRDLRIYIPFIDYLATLDKEKYKKMLQIKEWILGNKRFSVEILEKLEKSILIQYRNLFLIDKKIPEYVMDIFNKKEETKVETINLCSDDEADVEVVEVEEVSIIPSNNTLSEVPKKANRLDLSDGEISECESDKEKNKYHTKGLRNFDKNLEKDAKEEDLKDIPTEQLDEETEDFLRRINSICFKAQILDGNDKQPLSSRADKNDSNDNNAWNDQYDGNNKNDRNDNVVFEDEDVYIENPFDDVEKPLFTRRSNPHIKDKDNSDIISHSNKIIQSRERRQEEFNEYNCKELNPTNIINKYRDDAVDIGSKHTIETISIPDDTLSDPEELIETDQNELGSNTAYHNDNLEEMDIEELTTIFKNLIKCNNMNSNRVLKELASTEIESTNTRSPSPKLCTDYAHTAVSGFPLPIKTYSRNTMNTSPENFAESIKRTQALSHPILQKIEMPQVPCIHQSSSSSIHPYPIFNVNGRKINLNDPRVRQHLKSLQNSPVWGLAPQLVHQARIHDTGNHSGISFPSAPIQPATYGEYKRLKAEKAKEIQRCNEIKSSEMEKMNMNKLNQRTSAKEHGTAECVKQLSGELPRESTEVMKTKNLDDLGNSSRLNTVENQINSEASKSSVTTKPKNRAKKRKAKFSMEKINTNNLNQRASAEEQDTVECVKQLSGELPRESIEVMKTTNLDDLGVSSRLNTVENQINSEALKSSVTTKPKNRAKKRKAKFSMEKINTNNLNQRASAEEQDTAECVNQLSLDLPQESTEVMNTRNLGEIGNSSRLSTVENQIENEAIKSSVTTKSNNNDKKSKVKLTARLLKELECSVIGFNKDKDYLTTTPTGKRKSSETARDAIAKQLSGQQDVPSEPRDVGIQKALPRCRSSCNLSRDLSENQPVPPLPLVRRRETCTEADISNLLLDLRSNTHGNDEHCTNNNKMASPFRPIDTSSSDTDTFDFTEFEHRKAKVDALKNQPFVLLERLTQAELTQNSGSPPEQKVLKVQLVKAEARDAPEDIETVPTAPQTKSKTVPNTDEQMTERTAKSCVLCKVKPVNIVNHYIRIHKTESYVSRLTTQELENLQQNAFPFAVQCTSNASGSMAKYKVQCVFCAKELVDRFINFYAHYSTHTGEYAFQCLNCKIKKPFYADVRSHQCKVKACKKAHIQKLYIYPSNLMVIYLHCCRLCNFVQLNEANVYKHLREQHYKGSDEPGNVQKYVAAAINDAEIVNELMPTEDDEYLDHGEETSHTDDHIFYEYDKVIKQEFSSQDSLFSEPRLRTASVPNAHMTVIPKANLTTTQKTSLEQEFSSQDSVCPERLPRTHAVTSANMTAIPEASLTTTQEISFEQEFSSRDALCSERLPRTDAVPSTNMTVITETNLTTTQQTSLEQEFSSKESLCSERLPRTDAVSSANMAVIPKANLTTTQETGLEHQKTDSVTQIKSEVELTVPVAIELEVKLEEPIDYPTEKAFFLSCNPVHSQYRLYSGDFPYFGLFKCTSEDCLFSTDNDGEMLKHLNGHNNGKYPAANFLECCYCQFLCGECGSAQELIAHIKETHSRSRFQCSKCCYRSCVAGNVLLHHSMLHSTDSDEPFVYECFGNSQTVHEKLPVMLKAMSEHVKKLKCIHCSRSFSATKSLIKHLEEAHNSSFVDTSCLQEYACIYCVQNCVKKTDMQIHLALNHPDELSFACRRILKEIDMEDAVPNLMLWDIREIVQSTSIRKPNTAGVELCLEGLKEEGCVNNTVEQCFESEEPEQLDSKPSSAQLEYIWEETVRALLDKLTSNTGIQPDQLYHCPIATCGGFFSSYSLWSRHMQLRHNCLLARCPHCPVYNELTLSDFQQHFEQHSRHLHVCFHCIKTFVNKSSAVSHFENDHSKDDRFRFETVKFNILHSYHIIINEEAYVGRLECLQALKDLITCRLEVLANEEKAKLLAVWQVPNHAEWIDHFAIPNALDKKNCMMYGCPYIANNEDDLFQHLKVTHGPCPLTKFQCHKCFLHIERVNSWETIAEHTKLHNFIHVCCVCKFQHFGRQHLSAHVQLEHNNRDVPYVKMFGSGEDTFVSFGVIFAASRRTFSTTRICFFCNATNLNAESYSKHLKRVHNVFLNYYCELCNTPLQKLSDINTHYTSNHTDSHLKASCEFLSQNQLLVRTISPLNLEIIQAETRAGTKRSSATLTPPSDEVQSKRFKVGNCASSPTLIKVKRELINDGDGESDCSVEIMEDEDIVGTEDKARSDEVEKALQPPTQKVRCISLSNLLENQPGNSRMIQAQRPIATQQSVTLGKRILINILKKGPKTGTKKIP